MITLGEIIWNEFFVNADWPMASSITIIVTLVILTPMMLAKSMLGRK